MREAQTGVLLLMKALAQQESEVAHIQTPFLNYTQEQLCNPIPNQNSQQDFTVLFIIYSKVNFD